MVHFVNCLFCRLFTCSLYEHILQGSLYCISLGLSLSCRTFIWIHAYLTRQSLLNLMYSISRHVKLSSVFSKKVIFCCSLNLFLVLWILHFYTAYLTERPIVVHFVSYLSRRFFIVGLVVNMSDYWSWGRTSTNFKCGLNLERGPPSLVRTIGELLDWGVADLIEESRH